MSEKHQGKDKSKVSKKKQRTDERGSTSRVKNQRSTASASGLLANDKTVNSSLSSLFAVKQPVKAKAVAASKPRETRTTLHEENDAQLSEIDEDIEDETDDDEAEHDIASSALPEGIETDDLDKPVRKRKRKDEDEQLEGVYMNRLAREEEKEAKRLAAERASKRSKREVEKPEAISGPTTGEDRSEDSRVQSQIEGDQSDAYETEDEDDEVDTPPKHETQQQADEELAKANRTVFLGNVSTSAITSKSARKSLLNHLGSFFPGLPAAQISVGKPKVESLRFRSTAYASAIPKKAAYAKQELMDATTKSTNAYAVYSSQALAREAAKRLNGTIVIGRHLRVDEVAHPAKVDHRRCIFVGNLGFVDDESNIQEANEEEGREKRKRGKEPADVEEGLWRTFGKCGRVESVRVIRDSTTRVGKGIAYVQFDDENAVEAALLYNEKKFPPMLPRKLRVARAKAQKRNAKPGSDRPSVSKPSASGYQRKITGAEASKLGRTGKLFGRAAAAQVHHRTSNTRPAKARGPTLGDGIKKPESFIFEGHRASVRQGKSGLKLGGKHGKKKGSKITKRSSSFKSKKKDS